MNITEIRVKLIENQRDKLRGFASITLESSLVIRDLKIIDGTRGLFVAMPSRKLHDRCSACAGKNHIRARYCNDCGARLPNGRGDVDERGRVRLYADIAHPIHQDGRDEVQRVVVAAYDLERERSKQAGYVAQRFDDMDYHHHDDAAD